MYKSKEERNEYQRRHYAENEHVRIKQREATKRWQEKHPQEFISDSYRGYWLKNRYSITVEQYEERLANQGGHCALCSAVQPENSRRMAVDHDHKCCRGIKCCGKCIRGILCANCNRKAGFLEEIMSDGMVMPGYNTWTSRALNYIESFRLTTS